MPWFLERDDESLKLETHYDSDMSGAVVIVRNPDGRDIERFTDGHECRLWLDALQQNLTVRNSTGRSGPIVLSYGCPSRRCLT